MRSCTRAELWSSQPHQLSSGPGGAPSGRFNSCPHKGHLGSQSFHWCTLLSFFVEEQFWNSGRWRSYCYAPTARAYATWCGRSFLSPRESRPRWDERMPGTGLWQTFMFMATTLVPLNLQEENPPIISQYKCFSSATKSQDFTMEHKTTDWWLAVDTSLFSCAFHISFNVDSNQYGTRNLLSMFYLRA